MRPGLAVTLCAGLGLAASAQGRRGSVRGIDPPWAVAGALQVLKVHGDDLPAAEIRFDEPAVQARILRTEAPGDRRRGNTVVEIEVRTTAPLRPRPQTFVLAGPDGSEAAGAVLFDVPAPEVAEEEPNNDLRKPQPLPGPCTVNGKLDGDGADVFRFHARPGETWRIEVFAKRLKAECALEAVLRLRDPRGAAVRTAVNQGRDCAIEYPIVREGLHLIELFDGEGQTAGNLNYRLTLRRW